MTLEIIYLVCAIVIAILLFAFLADTTVSFSPLRIKFGTLHNAIGWILIAIAIAFMSVGEFKRGYKKGVEQTRRDFIEMLEQELEETETDSNLKYEDDKTQDSRKLSETI